MGRRTGVKDFSPATSTQHQQGCEQLFPVSSSVFGRTAVDCLGTGEGLGQLGKLEGDIFHLFDVFK